MIQPEELYDLLHGAPFQPFRVILKDGRRYDVVNKHAAVVGRNSMTIGTPFPDQRYKEWPICESTEYIDIANIKQIEMLDDSELRSENAKISLSANNTEPRFSGVSTMIEPEKLYSLLHDGEFQPFRVYLNDGRHYDVVNRHTAVVGQTYMSIGKPLPEQAHKDWPVCESSVNVDIADIVRFEMHNQLKNSKNDSNRLSLNGLESCNPAIWKYICSGDRSGLFASICWKKVFTKCDIQRWLFFDQHP